MLVKNQLVEISWTPATKNWLESKGYEFTGYRKKIQIKAEDLQPSSHIKVVVQCDYCENEFATEYLSYLRSIETGKCCCKKCQKLKYKDSCMAKYGVKNALQSKEIQDRIKETNEKRYGKGNVAHTPEIAEKIKNKNIKKYGVPYVFQAEEVISKIRQSLYKNNVVPSSKPESSVCDLLESIYGIDNCYRGYPVDRINMDCMINLGTDKIDVEYDGWYYHKDRQEKDKRRNYFLIKQGYKVLRIKGNKKDDIPTKEQIIEAIDCLVKGNQSYIEIKMDI